MKGDSVAWDLDGVLLDSRAASWSVATAILAQLGIHVHVDSQELFRRYFTGAGVLLKHDTATLRFMHRSAMDRYAHQLELFPCITLVGRLSVKADLVTSSTSAFAERSLGTYAGLFRNIYGHERGDKAVLLSMLPSGAIYVTDTVVDIARCRATSRTVIAVGWGYDPPAVLRNARPDFLVESAGQLEELLGELGLLTAALQ